MSVVNFFTSFFVNRGKVWYIPISGLNITFLRIIESTFCDLQLFNPLVEGQKWSQIELKLR